jgi:TolA-binding protein
MMLIRPAFLALPLCAVLLLPAAARAQDETRQEIAVQNQILELRHDLDQLRDQVASGSGGSAIAPPAAAPQPQYDSGAAPAPGSTDVMPMLLQRVSQLEDQMRTLQGNVDELRNGLQKQNDDLGKQISDLSFRVQTLEGGNPPAAGATPPDAPGAPPVIAPPVRPVDIPARPAVARATLQQGYAALARRDYPSAEAAARQALATPHAPHAYDAQFLLAQSLAGQRNYAQAALAYDDTYRKQPTGGHAPDALVGLASSLTALGEKPAACATLGKLHAEFPDERADVRASAAGIGRRAGCR